MVCKSREHNKYQMPRKPEQFVVLEVEYLNGKTGYFGPFGTKKEALEFDENEINYGKNYFPIKVVHYYRSEN